MAAVFSTPPYRCYADLNSSFLFSGSALIPYLVPLDSVVKSQSVLVEGLPRLLLDIDVVAATS
jgi:hypothetical protein